MRVTTVRPQRRESFALRAAACRGCVGAKSSSAGRAGGRGDAHFDEERAWVLSVGQAQKEFSHNEALQTLDLLVAGAVEEVPQSAPPPAPQIGACYIVAAEATDAWAGKAQSVAGWTSGGWRFIAPLEGMSVYVRSTGTWASFRNGAWEIGLVRGTAVMIADQQVVGSRTPAIAGPSGGTTVDAQARGTIEAILGSLRQHGLIEI